MSVVQEFGKIREMVKKKGSAVWLIIFLCLIIIGLVWLVVSSRCQQRTGLLMEEIQRLKKEVAEREKAKEKEIEELKDSLLFQPASPSASPSGGPIATPSSFLEPMVATSAGESGDN